MDYGFVFVRYKYQVAYGYLVLNLERKDKNYEQIVGYSIR